MMTQPLLVNPMIEGQTSDTLGRCAEGLSYLAETIVTLREHDASPMAYQGMQNLLDGIQQALLYETERLNNTPTHFCSKKEH